MCRQSFLAWLWEQRFHLEWDRIDRIGKSEQRCARCRHLPKNGSPKALRGFIVSSTGFFVKVARDSPGRTVVFW